jgi:zinc transporter 2
MGGYMSHSLAILTDAAHLLSDVASMGISIAAIKLAQNPATKEYTFGFAKAEVLGALISVMMIWVLTGGLVYEAICRLIQPTEVDGEVMCIVAVSGLLVNIAMLTILGGHGHSHGPSGDHGHAHSEAEDDGLNLQVTKADIEASI